MISLPFVLIIGLWISLDQRAWWPIVTAVVFVVLLFYADIRYIPLARISSREVTVHRLLGAFVAAFLVASAVLAVLGARVGL